MQVFDEVMAMAKILPAIDILNDKAVRFVKGRGEPIVYGEARDFARKWTSEGADVLHIMDMDAVKSTGRDNSALIAQIIEDTGLPAHVGGGIRSKEAIDRYLSIPETKIMITTIAVKNPALVKEASSEYDPERIIIAADVEGGKVAIKGWTETRDITPEQLVRSLYEHCGILMFTWIETEGQKLGTNYEFYHEMRRKFDKPIVAAGGIGTLEHISKLADTDVDYIVVGRALYDEVFTFKEAVERAKR